MEEIKQKANLYGQSHIFQFWDILNDEEKIKFEEDLSTIDFEPIEPDFKKCLSQLEKIGQKLDSSIEPPPQECVFSSTKGPKEEVERFIKIGYNAVSSNEVAVLLLAGGQGTRLGVPYPKGMYDVGLPSKKSLYQIQAERIIKIQRSAMNQIGSTQSATIPWYIMVSHHTKEVTQKYFNDNNYFGLKKENIIFFEQRLIPCLDFEGKIILESKCKVAKAPDGNGGLYVALKDANIIEDMEKRGIRHVFVHGVDNILVKIADPAFIGYCEDRKVCCAAKVIEKKEPDEAVGVVCKIKNRYGVVEYSEISKETSEMRASDGRLLFRAANIVNHYINFEFLKEICSKWLQELNPHVAKKKIPFANENGDTIKPDKPNGIKMEKFVFDIFQFAENFALWEVDKDDEFAPLKNAEGASSATPSICRDMLLNLCKRYILNAGGKFSSNNGSENSIVCEISPLVSYSGEDLNDIVNEKTFTSPLLLYAEEEKDKSVINTL